MFYANASSLVLSESQGYPGGSVKSTLLNSRFYITEHTFPFISGARIILLYVVITKSKFCFNYTYITVEDITKTNRATNPTKFIHFITSGYSVDLIDS